MVDEEKRNEGESSNNEEEREGGKEEEDNYDDTEEYKNKISGEMDLEILPGSRIKVYWKGNGEWYLVELYAGMKPHVSMK